MNAPVTDKRTLAQAAVQALRNGAPEQARDFLQRVIDMGQADSSIWYGLACAHRDLGEADRMAAALDKALELEPRNLRALILKGDMIAGEGDKRRAATFYMTALRIAEQAPQLPPDVQQDVARMEDAIDKHTAEFGAFLRERVETLSGAPLKPQSRFAQSLEIMTGAKQRYFQQPRRYYFPELPQVQFYDPAQFEWRETVEAATDAIRGELQGVMGDEAAFNPYVEGRDDLPQHDTHGMRGNTDWSAFYLWKDGARQDENADRCLATEKALDAAPVTDVKGRLPSILFSKLAPRSRIPAHNGLVNTRLICHLPLIVPDGCGFRVGNETREWNEGQLMIFDDSIEHEAWNDSAETRVILLFEIWRPELTEEERAQVTAMLQAIDQFGGD